MEFRFILWGIGAVVILLVVCFWVYSSHESRKNRRNMKYGHDLASSIPDDDGTVGPVRTVKRTEIAPENVQSEGSDSPADPVQSAPSVSIASSSAAVSASGDRPQKAWAKYYQFNIVSRDHRPFTFAKLKEVFAAEKLAIGKYDIVYYNDPATGKELFRVSSMIKPGTFPKGITGAGVVEGSWSTKGICVIMFMPEPGTAERRFDEIIRHVNSINTALDGLLCTRELRPMTDDVINEYRSQMKAYDRQ
ncbi:MAG: hypothetical protein IJ523_01155 [Succinivibrionaceae bacterium]|nr:hypothetical protein [Succinivibrionaceae bacterium]